MVGISLDNPEAFDIDLTEDDTIKTCRSRVELRNVYHQTSVHVLVNWDDTGQAVLSPSQVRHVQNSLCAFLRDLPTSRCGCGGVLCEAGPQDVEIVQGYDILGQTEIMLRRMR